MWAIVNGIASVVATLTFLGIVWWAFSSGRAKANQEASLLPFALPDESAVQKREGNNHE